LTKKAPKPAQASTGPSGGHIAPVILISKNSIHDPLNVALIEMGIVWQSSDSSDII